MEETPPSHASQMQGHSTIYKLSKSLVPRHVMYMGPFITEQGKGIYWEALHTVWPAGLPGDSLGPAAA